MNKKNISIGYSDYKKLIDDKCYYVDKTLLIQEFLNLKNEVTLICRPRRFGKTISLSMLKYFFEHTQESNAYLFEDKKIWANKEIAKKQGTYPVIFLSFKDIKDENFSQAYENIKLLISAEFKRHLKSLESILMDYELDDYKSILNRTADITSYSHSLLFLSELLHRKYNKKVMIFLDEYDTPIHSSYNNNYYKEMVSFIKMLFSKALKDNINLELSLLTGILRTAKEGMFSGLNNLSIYTTLNNGYCDKFGFTQDEITKILEEYDLDKNISDVKIWYNGYQIGNSEKVYNPWSILNYVKNNGLFDAYWVNTSDNYLIKELLVKASSSVKIELESLLNDNSITKIIEPSFTFDKIYKNENILWSLLFFAGYLTHTKLQITDKTEYECNLILPNKEIKSLFLRLINEIFKEVLVDNEKIKTMVEAVFLGDVEQFSESLQEFIINSISYYDFDDKEPEKSYHIFILGLFAILQGIYEVKSNRESGYGRYDITLIPKDKTKTAVIFEFKRAKKMTLKKATDLALDQIDSRYYIQELVAQNIKKIIAYGIAFEGKKLLIKSKNIK